MKKIFLILIGGIVVSFCLFVFSDVKAVVPCFCDMAGEACVAPVADQATCDGCRRLHPETCGAVPAICSCDQSGGD